MRDLNRIFGTDSSLDKTSALYIRERIQKTIDDFQCEFVPEITREVKAVLEVLVTEVNYDAIIGATTHDAFDTIVRKLLNTLEAGTRREYVKSDAVYAEVCRLRNQVRDVIVGWIDDLGRMKFREGYKTRHVIQYRGQNTEAKE